MAWTAGGSGQLAEILHEFAILFGQFQMVGEMVRQVWVLLGHGLEGAIDME